MINRFPALFGAIIILAAAKAPLFAQEAESTGPPAADPAESAAPAETAQPVEPEEDLREQILLYGIDEDVLTVLGDLKKENNSRYNELLLDVLSETGDGKIANGVYGLWAQTEWPGGLGPAREELAKVIDDEDYLLGTMQAAIAYLAGLKDAESIADLALLADNRNLRLAASAVRAVGVIGEETDPAAAAPAGAALFERMQDTDPDVEEDLYASLITALGQLAYLEAADELAGIAESEGSRSGHRRLACVALGQIGRSEDFQIVEQVYYDSDDAILRSYALAGLADFPDADTTGTLVQALKRDSFWRIRVTAAEKLGEKPTDSAIGELLRYKAGNDPVNPVRLAALESLGQYQDDENRDFILDFFADKLKPADMRLAALNVMVDNAIPGSVESIQTVMADLWEKDQGRFLEFVCRELSMAEWGELSPLYERMLDHPNWLMKVYGIRGIRLNSLAALYGNIDALDVEGTDGKVRREITAGRSEEDL